MAESDQADAYLGGKPPSAADAECKDGAAVARSAYCIAMQCIGNTCGTLYLSGPL